MVLLQSPNFDRKPSHLFSPPSLFSFLEKYFQTFPKFLRCVFDCCFSENFPFSIVQPQRFGIHAEFFFFFLKICFKNLNWKPNLHLNILVTLLIGSRLQLFVNWFFDILVTLSLLEEGVFLIDVFVICFRIQFWERLKKSLFAACINLEEIITLNYVVIVDLNIVIICSNL